MSATPRPWKSILAAGNAIDIEGDGEVVCSITADSELEEVHEANAALIVQAVNTLDEAKAVLGDMLRYLEAGPIKTKDDIEFCKGKIKAVLAKLEGGAR